MNAQWHNACLLAIQQQVEHETNGDPCLLAYTREDLDEMIDERFEALYQLLLAKPRGTA